MSRQSESISEEENRKQASSMTGILYYSDPAELEETIQ